jgi:hypothetical protein
MESDAPVSDEAFAALLAGKSPATTPLRSATMVNGKEHQ